MDPHTLKCPDCVFTTSNKFALMAHSRAHKNVKFECQGCKKNFNYHGAFIGHQVKCKKFKKWKDDRELEKSKLSNAITEEHVVENIIENNTPNILSFGTPPRPKTIKFIKLGDDENDEKKIIEEPKKLVEVKKFDEEPKKISEPKKIDDVKKLVEVKKFNEEPSDDEYDEPTDSPKENKIEIIVEKKVEVEPQFIKELNFNKQKFYQWNKIDYDGKLFDYENILMPKIIPFNTSLLSNDSFVNQLNHYIKAHDC